MIFCRNNEIYSFYKIINLKQLILPPSKMYLKKIPLVVISYANFIFFIFQTQVFLHTAQVEKSTNCITRQTYEDPIILDIRLMTYSGYPTLT